MKTAIVPLVIIALLLFTGSAFVSSSAQDTTNDDKPTFYRLTPGVYVNGWPRFTVHYPKDWVEKSRSFSEVFRVEPPPSAPRSVLAVNVGLIPLPIDRLADNMVPWFRAFAQDVTVVNDKPSRLKDGTPAREVETKMVMNGEPVTMLNVATKKGDLWVLTGTRSYGGKIEEYQRAMLYSLQYGTDKDKPAKVPPDVQEFLDKMDNDVVSHDLVKVMTHYSDKYLDSGGRKGERERFWRQAIDSLMSSKRVITDFVAGGDRAYLTGFETTNIGTLAITEISIIKEKGEWF
jgi:hypothetical protein